MKKNLFKTAAIIITVLSLSSCSNSKANQTPQPEYTSVKTEITTEASTENEMLSYYESAISQLESSIIKLQEEFYITEQEYKSTIQDLEEKIIYLSTQKPSDSTSSENISYNPFSYVIQNGIATITSYSGTLEKVTVPATIGKVSVKKIGEFAFSSGIRSIIISDGIEEIDWFAFSQCSTLQEIYIPASVTLIGYGAFDGCPKNLIIRCPASSYAEAYAKSFALNYILE